MDELKLAIREAIDIPDTILDEFVGYWEPVIYKKGKVLSEPDRTDKFLHFTISGVQKAYYLNDGKQNIISFTQANHFSCAPESFLTQKPSKYFFECSTDSTLYRLSHHSFTGQLNKHREIQEFLLISLMGLVNNINERFIKQLTCTIEQKFRDFMLHDAHLINEIPHKDIANYLGMNATNFSKLLNNVVVK